MNFHNFDDEFVNELSSCVYANQHMGSTSNTGMRLPQNMRQLGNPYLQGKTSFPIF